MSDDDDWVWEIRYYSGGMAGNSDEYITIEYTDEEYYVGKVIDKVNEFITEYL